MVVLTAAALFGCRLLWRAATPGDDWVMRYQRAYEQFSNAAVLAALSVGFPLIVAGLIHRHAALPVSLASWALATGVGVRASVGLWRSQPSLRLDPAFWDEGAQIGSGSRRRSIVLIATTLVFATLAGGLLLVAR